MRLAGPDDARLYFEQDMREPEAHAVPGGQAAVYSAGCPGGSGPNQDAAALIPFDAGSSVLIVADGVGGAPAGEQAARIAVETVWTGLAEAARAGGSLRPALLDAIESANQAVSGLGGGAATTLAAVEVSAQAVRPYHVGDSLILVVGQGGRIKLQTVSHSPVGFAVEAGVLDEAEAMHHEQRHLVSNVLGAPDMRVEVGSALELAPRDTVLLASDGLADNLRTGEIVERLRRGPLWEALARLAADSRSRMEGPAGGEPCKPDDLTCVAYRRGRAPTPAATAPRSGGRAAGSPGPGRRRTQTRP